MIDHLKILWQQSIPTGFIFWTNPIVYGNTIILRQGTNVHCFSQNDGNKNWTLEYDKAGSEGRFLFSLGEAIFTEFSHGPKNKLSGIIAIDCESGKEKWRLAMNSIITKEKITSLGDRIFTIDHSNSLDRFIHEIDPIRGIETGKIDIPFPSTVDIFAFNNALLCTHPFPTSDNPGLYILFPEKGNTRVLKKEPVYKLITNSKLFCALTSNEDGKTYQVEVFDKSFEPIWRAHSDVPSVALDDYFLFTSVAEGDKVYVQIFKVDTGELLYKIPLPVDKVEVFYSSNGLLSLKCEYEHLFIDGFEGKIISHISDYNIIVASHYFNADTRVLFTALVEIDKKNSKLYAILLK